MGRLEDDYKKSSLENNPLAIKSGDIFPDIEHENMLLKRHLHRLLEAIKKHKAKTKYELRTKYDVELYKAIEEE